MQIVSQEGGGSERKYVCVYVWGGDMDSLNWKAHVSSMKDWAMIVFQTTQMNVRGNPHQSLDSRALTSTCTHAHMHARAHTFRPASNINHLSCSGIFLGEPKGTSVGYYAMFSSFAHTHTHIISMSITHTNMRTNIFPQTCQKHCTSYIMKSDQNTKTLTAYSWNLMWTQKKN